MSFNVARIQLGGSSPKDVAAQRAHDQVVKLGSRLDTIPILEGSLLADIEFTAGTTRRIGHGLGRPYRGFLITLQTAAGTLVHTPAAEASKNELALTPSATMTASLWIF